MGVAAQHYPVPVFKLTPSLMDGPKRVCSLTSLPYSRAPSLPPSLIPRFLASSLPRFLAPSLPRSLAPSLPHPSPPRSPSPYNSVRGSLFADPSAAKGKCVTSKPKDDKGEKDYCPDGYNVRSSKFFDPDAVDNVEATCDAAAISVEVDNKVQGDKGHLRATKVRGGLYPEEKIAAGSCQVLKDKAMGGVSTFTVSKFGTVDGGVKDKPSTQGDMPSWGSFFDGKTLCLMINARKAMPNAGAEPSAHTSTYRVWSTNNGNGLHACDEPPLHEPLLRDTPIDPPLTILPSPRHFNINSRDMALYSGKLTSLTWTCNVARGREHMDTHCSRFLRCGVALYMQLFYIATN